MNHRLKSPLLAAVSVLFLTAHLLASAGRAEEGEQPNPLRIDKGDSNSFLQASVGLGLASLKAPPAVRPTGR